MATCWEKAAHFAYDMFFLYKDLVVDLVLFDPWFLGWDFLSDCAIFGSF